MKAQLSTYIGSLEPVVNPGNTLLIRSAITENISVADNGNWNRWRGLYAIVQMALFVRNSIDGAFCNTCRQ